VDLYQEPATVAILAHNAHSIRVLLLTAFCHCRLRPLGQKPSNGPGGTGLTAIPRPRVRGRPPHVELKERPYLIGASQKRFLGRDHYDVGIPCEEPHDTVGIPRGEAGAETLEDFKQRGFRLRVRSHGEAILTSFRRSS
jgi:hypothetical protein